MKKLRPISKLKLGAIAGLATALAGAGLLRFAFAAGQLRLQPNTSSVQNGGTVSVAIRINPDQPVDGVEATVTYDQSKLQFVAIDSSNSAFPIELLNSGGSGTVQVTRGHLTGTVSGDSLVANVTFKAVAGSGNTTVQITGNATAGGAYINPGFANATIALTTPVSPSPTSPTPKPPAPSPAPSPSPGTKPTTPSPNPPSGGGQTADGIEIHKKRIEFTRAILRAVAKKKVRVYLVYGTEKEQLKTSTHITELGTEHDLVLNENLVVPGVTFYYKVVAEDEQGNKSETPVESFKTKGFKVKLLVTDSRERPVVRQKVTIHSDPVTVETDENGFATVEDMSPGLHTVEYNQNGQVYSKAITVAGTMPIKAAEDGAQYADPENVQVSLPNLQFAESSRPSILPASIAVALVAIAGVVFLVIKRRQNRLVPVPGSGPDPFIRIQPPSTPPVAPPAGSNEELIQKVKGGDKPNPGSIVSPNRDKDER